MKRKFRAVRDVRRLAVLALGRGAVLRSPAHVEWEASGDCETPRFRELHGRAESGRGPWRYDWSTGWTEAQGIDKGTLVLSMWVPCRRCRSCLRRRAAHWRFRAECELQAAPRTWFGTLTCRADVHYQHELKASLRLLRGGTVWSRDLSDEEQFRERAKEGSRELTLWLKRVRKEAGVPLRYLLVTEAHKSGLPHWHCLIHEVEPDGHVSWRTLARQWGLGFNRFSLVGPSDPAASYVCKYLAKAALTRVRASQDYGRPDAEASVMRA